MEVPAGHGPRGRAGDDGQPFDPDAVGCDRPSRLRLPVVVDHGDAELVLGPAERLRVAALACEKECAELREVVAADVLAVRILLTDGAEGCRRGEERTDAVLRADTPERAGIGRADWLPLVEDARATVQQRAVHGVGVPDRPADVRRGPVHLARVGVVDVLHRPRQRDRVAAVVADDPLRLPGRPGRVDDVERVGRSERHAVHWLGARECLVPFQIARRVEVGLEHRPLEDDAAIRLPVRRRDRRVEERLVLDDAPRLDPARGRDDDLRLRVVDTRRELVRREPTEDDRVHCPYSRAGKHRDERLRDHRHVDDHPISVPDALRRECPSEARDRIAELAVREHGLCIGDRRVVDQCRLVGAAAVDVPVERVPARVHPASCEPAEERRPRVVEHTLPRLDPVDRLRSVGPELFGLFERTPIDLLESAHRPRRYASAASSATHGPADREPALLIRRARFCEADEGTRTLDLLHGKPDVCRT